MQYIMYTVCSGKTKTLGVLHDLSTDDFGIIKRGKHPEGDHWKSAFEWAPKDIFTFPHFLNEKLHSLKGAVR